MSIAAGDFAEMPRAADSIRRSESEDDDAEPTDVGEGVADVVGAAVAGCGAGTMARFAAPLSWAGSRGSVPVVVATRTAADAEAGRAGRSGPGRDVRAVDCLGPALVAEKNQTGFDQPLLCAMYVGQAAHRRQRGPDPVALRGAVAIADRTRLTADNVVVSDVGGYGLATGSSTIRLATSELPDACRGH